MKIKKIRDAAPSLFENLIFATGLLFLGWSPLLIVFGYWVEVVLVFFAALAKLLLLRFLKRDMLQGAGMFVFQYLFIIFVHTVFFIILIVVYADRDPFIVRLLHLYTGVSVNVSVEGFAGDLMRIVLVVGVTVVYGFFTSFLLHHRYRMLDARQVINHAFGPVVLLHFVLFVGVGAIGLLGLPGSFVLVLIAAKFFFDVSGIGERGVQAA
ncbi:MAG TPA: DUF6498-containing protein [Spirochaetota bacterium]|nr:DUF6498-containing protein [Spirochaetota bacterium]